MGIVRILIFGALCVLAGHFLWPESSDPRITPWLERETAYRGQLAALERDTARLSVTVDSLRNTSRGHYSIARDTILSVAASIDTALVPKSGTDTAFVLIHRDSLETWNAKLRNAVLRYAKGHNADSLALEAERARSRLLIARLATADSLLNVARPIIADTRRRHGWRTDAALLGLGVLAGFALAR